jgi:DNA-binding MarR family transcriptional regulator
LNPTTTRISRLDRSTEPPKQTTFRDHPIHCCAATVVWGQSLVGVNGCEIATISDVDEHDDRAELAARAWRLQVAVAQRHFEATGHGLTEMGLSKVMAQFLGAIGQLPPGPTNQLAELFGVDPSWVTDNVDRLEARGYVVRRASPSDRRVKILELTEAGRAMFERLDALMYAPPPVLETLSRKDLLHLVQIGQRLAAPDAVSDAPAERSLPDRG